MRAPILLLLLLSVFLSTSASAQRDQRLRTGAQVRLTASLPEFRLATGKVASIDADTIVLERGGRSADSLRLALTGITALEVYHRGKDAVIAGNVFGAIGATGGAVLYIRWCLQHVDLCKYLESEDDPDDSDDVDEDEDQEYSMGVIVTFAFGAIGYALGYALAPPQWQVVNLPIQVGVAPMQRGVGVYVSLPAPRFTRGVR